MAADGKRHELLILHAVSQKPLTPDDLHRWTEVNAEAESASGALDEVFRQSFGQAH